MEDLEVENIAHEKALWSTRVVSMEGAKRKTNEGSATAW